MNYNKEYLEDEQEKFDEKAFFEHISNHTKFNKGGSFDEDSFFILPDGG